MASKISNKTISEMFLSEIPVDYTSEDIESARIVYLTNPLFSLDHLLTFRSKCSEILIETLIMLYDNLEITNIRHFPFSIFRKFIESGDFDGISITQQICEQRQNFYINLLYTVCTKKENENIRQFLSNISVILSFKNCIKTLKNKELWGLSRERTGFYLKNDVEILNLCLRDLWDITQTNHVKNLLLNHHPEMSDSFMNDSRSIDLSNQVIFDSRFLFSAEPYHLPFFLQDAFSLINGFSPSDKLESKDIIEFDNIINQLYEIIHPLLLDLDIKNNFIDLISNVYNQDRTKLVYEAEINCSDSFCYTLMHILLKVSKNILNDSFISKIDEKKFPTFCFFNISRLMEISLSRLIGDLKEDYNKKNIFILLSFENSLIIQYFTFVFNLIDNRQDEVFNVLANQLKNLNLLSDELSDRIENIRIESKEIDIKDFVFKSSKILAFTPEDAKAKAVAEILADSSFLSTILSMYSFYLGFAKGTNKSVLTVINYLLAYKNTFSMDCLHILNKSHYVLNSSIISRIVQVYSLRDDNNYYEARHIIHSLLRDCEFEVNIETLRMFSACLGSMEENLSSIFDSIQKINNYNEKEKTLTNILNNNEEECFLSEDEEKITLFEDRFLDLVSTLTIQQLDKLLISRFGSDFENIKSLLLNNLKYRKNEFKLKVLKKIRINLSRKERTEKGLTGSIEFLNGLLVFVKSHTDKNRKAFLNKNIFFRLFSILNSALNLLAGEKASKIKIPNKEAYGLDAKEILRKVVLIVINMLNSNEKLIQSSGLDSNLVQKAIDLCNKKQILNELQIHDLERIYLQLKSVKDEISQDDSLSLEDIPEEFVDPLTFILMRNPVIMSTSKITIDMTTFRQIMLNDQLDPFSRMPINETMITSNTELKKQIDEFLKSKNKKN